MIPNSISEPLKPLARHLDSQGVEWSRTKHGWAARVDGEVVSTFSTNKAPSFRVVKIALSQLRREHPELVEGFNNGRKAAPAKATPVKKPRADSRPQADIDRSNATRIRWKACLDEHFEGKYRKFAEWAIDVQEAEHMRGWKNFDSAAVGLGDWFNHENKTIRPYLLDVVDKAIDAAYGTEPYEKPEPVASPEQREAERQEQKQAIRDAAAGRAEAIVQAEPAPVVTVGTLDIHVEPVEPPKPVEPHLPDTMGDVRKRYIDMLFKLAEEGNAEALDRLERIIGL